MFERIFEMVRKEFRQTLRDPRARTLLIGPPIIQLIIFGFAVNLDVGNVRTAWMDSDRTAESRALRKAYEGSPNFTILYEPSSAGQIRTLLDKGEADVVLSVEPGFGIALNRGEAARVQILVDGSNSNTASIVSAYSRQVLSRFGAEWAVRQQNVNLVPASLAAGGAVKPQLPRLDVRSRVWFNPDLRSRDYFVPAVIGLVMTLITMTLTALAIVREKEIGTMEQLMVTPLRPVELMLGKTIPFVIVGILQVLLMTGLALLVFGVPFRGSVALLAFGGLLYLMTTLGMGLLISVVSHTQQQAMMLSFFVTLPVILLSGFAFPVANMPAPIQWVTLLNPARYFIEIIRAIFLKGVGISILWPQFAALFVIGAVILAINSKRFHKRLE
jgi:ABC-2 type transport system permease protein